MDLKKLEKKNALIANIRSAIQLCRRTFPNHSDATENDSAISAVPIHCGTLQCLQPAGWLVVWTPIAKFAVHFFNSTTPLPLLTYTWLLSLSGRNTKRAQFDARVVAICIASPNQRSVLSFMRRDKVFLVPTPNTRFLTLMFVTRSLHSLLVLLHSHRRSKTFGRRTSLAHYRTTELNAPRLSTHDLSISIKCWSNFTGASSWRTPLEP